MSKAESLLIKSCFEPKTARAIIGAFDAGWASTRFMFVGQPQSIIEDAKTALASGVLNAAQAGHTETEVLRSEGLRALKAAYPRIAV